MAYNVRHSKTLLDIPMNYCLTSLPKNTPAVIKSIEENAQTARLMSVGFVPGTRIEVMRTGNPMLVKITGSTFGVSPSLAKSIIVSND